MFNQSNLLPSNLAETYPQKEPADRAFDAARVALSLLPSGGPLEFLNLLLTPSVVRRREDWQQDVASVVDEISRRVQDFDLKDLQNNDQFISAVMSASRIAISTHQKEKRTLLRNALIKIGSGYHIDDDLTLYYLNLIEEFSVTHIVVLNFFWRGNQQIQERTRGIIPYTQGHEGIIYELYPEFRTKQQFIEQVIQDLRNRGLCMAQTITSGMSGQVMTDNGRTFLRFIQTDDDHLL